MLATINSSNIRELLVVGLLLLKGIIANKFNYFSRLMRLECVPEFNPLTLSLFYLLRVDSKFSFYFYEKATRNLKYYLYIVTFDETEDN